MARADEKPAFGLLDGVKVAFAGNAIAGPFAAEMWAENGADVIWIENPAHPDVTRNPMAMVLERDRLNIRNIALNAKDPGGQEALLAILKDTDIFLEASRGGQYAGWGLTDERLWEANPKLVIIHISGFGQTGLPEYVGRSSWDTIGQAFSGYMSLNGESDPIPAKPSLCDYVTALTACWSGTAALYRATTTGEGESIDLSMYEAMLRVQNDGTQQFATNGVQPARGVEVDPRSVGYRNYQCKDGKFINLVMVGPGALRAVLPILGLEWGSDDFPAFMPCIMAGTPGAEKFAVAIEQYCSKHTADEVQTELGGAGAPVQTIYDYTDLFADPQVRARGSLFDFEDPNRGTVKGAVSPVPKLARHPQRIWKSAPAVGGDSRDVLAEAGLSEERIAELIDTGVVASAD